MMQKNSTIETVFVYIMVAVGFGSIAIAFSLYVNIGMNEILKEIIVWLVASAIIGLVSTVYESERFTDITATMVHAPFTCIVALVCGWILDYGDGSFSLLVLRMLPTIVVLYAMIHLILFLIRRTALRKVNERLKK